MANFGINDVDNYGGGDFSYFTLKDDGDSAIVRFMYNDIDDIEGYAVHRVEFSNDRHIYVNCMREYNEPMDNCPLCANHDFQQARFFFNLYDQGDQSVKLWERGKQILKTLIPLLREINGPICGTPIKVIRHGVAGDRYTKYSFELMTPDGCTLDDLPEPVNPLGTVIRSYSIDELNTYISTGRLPGVTDSSNNFNPNPNNSDNNIRRRYTGRPDNTGRGGTGSGSTYY